MAEKTFSFDYNKAYTSSIEFNTIIDEKFTGNEQRRGLWTKPKRTWVLELDKNKVDREALADFFTARKGRKEAFSWVWKEDKGGDGKTYRVRFGTDRLEMLVLELGYSNFVLELVEVFE